MGIISGAAQQQANRVTNPAVLWTPANISLELWLDADDASTITHVANAVSQWDDKSGRAQHMIQATGSLQATYEASSTVSSGYAAIVSANNTKLGTASVVHDAVIIVASYGDGTHATFSDYSAVFNTASSDRILGNINQTAWIGDSNDTTPNLNGAVAGSSVVVPMLKTISRFEFATRGSAVTTDILHQNNNASRGWIGPVHEYIIPADGTILADLQRIEGYLAHKWGITLAVGHPYEFAPPLAP